jgi:hypothetical protein
MAFKQGKLFCFRAPVLWRELGPVCFSGTRKLDWTVKWRLGHSAAPLRASC